MKSQKKKQYLKMLKIILSEKKKKQKTKFDYDYSKDASRNDNKFPVESTLLLFSIENYKFLLCPC